MSDEKSASEEHLVVRRAGPDDAELAGTWLIEPAPAPDELRVIVQVGSELELSEPVRQALDELAAALQEGGEAEVSGFAMGGLQIGLAPGPGLGSRAAAAGCGVHFGCHSRSGIAGDASGRDLGGMASSGGAPTGV